MCAQLLRAPDACQAETMPFLYNCIKNIQTSLIGPRCLLCRGPASLDLALCADCRHELPALSRACRGCALPLPDDARTGLCPACVRSPRFDAALAAFAYDEPIRWLVTQLKFNGRLSHARLLGELLAQRVLTSDLDRPEALIPIPLHPAGLRRRGFNQAERIANRLARRLACALDTRALIRLRDTAPQSGLPASQRAANVRDAFGVSRPPPWRHVALVDDVVTTTRTAVAAARPLRAAGVTRIDLYCVARA